ncbi:MAG: carcinine hydrolase/isopenicillin-N N-acyltransferase family protein [Bacillota bacterium]
MCDTIVAFNKNTGRSFFAKNSDRERGELQYIQYSMDPIYEMESEPYLEAKVKYIRNSFPRLKEVFSKFPHTYRAVLSRPIWLWGAEMGMNEHGLAIGNGAVFSKKRAPVKGLLGMDILRLALHNAKTAKEALDFISGLIQQYGQGGDGGYRHSLRCCNSFLIKDAQEAYLLETSGKHWAAKKIKNSGAFSSFYALAGNYDSIDSAPGRVKNFAAKYGHKLKAVFSGGRKRQKYAVKYLGKQFVNLETLRKLLRSHGNKTNKLRHGAGTICMHAGFGKSESTSSMIVDYIGKHAVAWVTGSPYPCVSLYKPLVVSTAENHILPFANPESARAYADELGKTVKKLIRHYKFFQKYVKKIRDQYEQQFIQIIYEKIEKAGIKELADRCARCFELEKDYLREVRRLMENNGIF